MLCIVCSLLLFYHFFPIFPRWAHTEFALAKIAFAFLFICFFLSLATIVIINSAQAGGRHIFSSLCPLAKSGVPRAWSCSISPPPQWCSLRKKIVYFCNLFVGAILAHYRPRLPSKHNPELLNYAQAYNHSSIIFGYISLPELFSSFYSSFAFFSSH